ncbi:MAG: RhoGEF domain-containing protein [Candidatus Berkiellales bacterium]
MTTQGLTLDQKIEFIFNEVKSTEASFIKALDSLIGEEKKINQAITIYEQDLITNPAKYAETEYSSPEEIRAVLGAVKNLRDQQRKFYATFAEDKKPDPVILQKTLSGLVEAYKAYLKTNPMQLNVPPEILNSIGLKSRVELSNVLITPVQRGPRYVLLFQDLDKHVPGSGYNNRTKAQFGSLVEEAKSLASTCNEYERKLKESKEYELFNKYKDMINRFRRAKKVDELVKALIEEEQSDIRIVMEKLTDKEKVVIANRAIEHIDELGPSSLDSKGNKRRGTQNVFTSILEDALRRNKLFAEYGKMIKKLSRSRVDEVDAFIENQLKNPSFAQDIPAIIARFGIEDQQILVTAVMTRINEVGKGKKVEAEVKDFEKMKAIFEDIQDKFKIKTEGQWKRASPEEVAANLGQLTESNRKRVAEAMQGREKQRSSSYPTAVTGSGRAAAIVPEASLTRSHSYSELISSKAATPQIPAKPRAFGDSLGGSEHRQKTSVPRVPPRYSSLGSSASGSSGSALNLSDINKLILAELGSLISSQKGDTLLPSQRQKSFSALGRSDINKLILAELGSLISSQKEDTLRPQPESEVKPEAKKPDTPPRSSSRRKM